MGRRKRRKLTVLLSNEGRVGGSREGDEGNKGRKYGRSTRVLGRREGERRMGGKGERRRERGGERKQGEGRMVERRGKRRKSESCSPLPSPLSPSHAFMI